MNQSIVPCLVLTWPAYGFLRRQVSWSGILISLRIFHCLLWSTQSNVSVQSQIRGRYFGGGGFPCFLYDPMDVGNLNSASSTFSKPSLYIWKFPVQVLQKPSLKDFEYNFANMRNEHNFMVVWAFLGISFFVVGIKTDLLQSCGHCWVFQIYWHTECSTFTVSSFRI